MSGHLAPLAAGTGIGLDDLALVVFFLIVAVLKLLQKALQKRGQGPAPSERRAPPAPSPGPSEEDEEEPVVVRRAPPPSAAPRPAPRPAAPPPRPVTPLSRLEGLGTGGHADLHGRPAEAAGRAPSPPSGRALLLARDLPPRDRLRQNLLWTEVLRRPRPLVPPRARR